MTDKSIQEFLNELSSILPLTSEYEASMVTLNIYINLIKKIPFQVYPVITVIY